MGTLQIFDAAETATPDPPGMRYWGGGAAPPAGQEPAFAFRCPGYELHSMLTMALGWFGTRTEGHPFPPRHEDARGPLGGAGAARRGPFDLDLGAAPSPLRSPHMRPTHRWTGGGLALAFGLLAAPAPAAPTAAPIEETEGGRADVPATRWHTFLAAGGKAKVWAQEAYPDDVAKARAVASELSDRIWPELTGLFWQPLPDQGWVVDSENGPYEPFAAETGGGPELDIYLVRYGGTSVAAAIEGGKSHAAYPGFTCGRNPRYITLASDRPLGGARSPGMLNILAHELMHAIVEAVPWLDEDCSRYRWINEATATWAEHLVYPDAQSEHTHAAQYLNSTEQPLDFEVNEYDQRHYGLYLLPFEIALRGSQARLPALWRQFASRKPLAGIEAALGEKYATFFPRLMLDNWNRESVDLYRREDRLDESARVPDDPEVVALADGKWEKKVPLAMKYLSATYRYFRFPAGVKAVTFDNGLLGHPHAKAWAIEKIAGAWKDPRELTDNDGETWCRGTEGGDLDELVLVFSNTDWPETPVKESNRTSMIARGEHRLSAYATGCSAWVGRTTLTYMARTDKATLRESAEAKVRFILDPELQLPGQPPEYWYAVSGQVAWSASMTGECNGSYSGTVPIETDAEGNKMGTLQIYDPDGPGAGSPERRYVGGIAPWPFARDPKFFYHCPDGIELPAGLTLGSNWFQTDPTGHPFPEGTTTIAGRWEMPGLGPGNEVTWTWDLRQAP